MGEMDLKKGPPPTLRPCLRKRRQLQQPRVTLRLPGREWEPRHSPESATAARLKNLRWRLPAVHRRVCLEALPASLRLLAEEPAQATAASRQPSIQALRAALPCQVLRRPIEQAEAAPIGSVRWMRGVSQPATEGIEAASAMQVIQTPALAPEDSQAAQEAAVPRMGRHVSFCESVGLEEEVVLVYVPSVQRLRPLPTPAKRGAPTAEECAWANLAHLANNHNHVMELFTECFTCLQGLQDWRAAAKRFQSSLLAARSH